MTDIELAKTIKDAIHEALEGASFPQCALELQRITAIEDLSRKLSIIITGNGNPEKGLVVDFQKTKQDVENFHVEMRKEVQQLKEAEKEKRTREWGLIMVGLGLVATSLWSLLVK